MGGIWRHGPGGRERVPRGDRAVLDDRHPDGSPARSSPSCRVATGPPHPVGLLTGDEPAPGAACRSGPALQIGIVQRTRRNRPVRWHLLRCRRRGRDAELKRSHRRRLPPGGELGNPDGGPTIIRPLRRFPSSPRPLVDLRSLRPHNARYPQDRRARSMTPHQFAQCPPCARRAEEGALSHRRDRRHRWSGRGVHGS